MNKLVQRIKEGEGEKEGGVKRVRGLILKLTSSCKVVCTSTVPNRELTTAQSTANPAGDF